MKTPTPQPSESVQPATPTICIGIFDDTEELVMTVQEMNQQILELQYENLCY